jgi:hypothetical protein
MIRGRDVNRVAQTPYGILKNPEIFSPGWKARLREELNGMPRQSSLGLPGNPPVQRNQTSSRHGLVVPGKTGCRH